MHPIFRKAQWLRRYVAVWLGLAYMLADLFHMPGIALSWRQALVLAIPLCIFFAFVCLTPWYMCRQMPLGSARNIQSKFYHATAAVLATCLLVGLAQGIGYIFGFAQQVKAAIPAVISVGLLLYLLSVALHYLMLAFEMSQQAAIDARDAELRALKAQINPHFLFNSLNSITALTTSDPGRAREMCIRLSDFLRHTLGLGERQDVAWNEELDLTQAYLDVEQIRFGSRLNVEVRVDGKCGDCRVPPLVLQPLVENAVKHGIATLVGGGTIVVDSRVLEGQLRVCVENCFDPESPTPRRHGLGLRNVRSRLQTRFGDAGQLLTSADGNRFRAEMAVPCRTTD
ncbi:MAG: histidine kinase [Bryobacterales bacterium]|nr:histidine kinase [Bryobacterales bacterium]MBV9399794.1 histidine kinase [Bryobacterales bacterium]